MDVNSTAQPNQACSRPTSSAPWSPGALSRCGVLLACVLCFTAANSIAAAEQTSRRWPGWRGDGSGISAAGDLPLTWSKTSQVVWRSELPGEGSSSPIVWDDKIFVTASTDGGATRLVLCLAAKDGRELWRYALPDQRTPRTDPKAGYAAATPVTDGKRVYVFFDSPGLLALDMQGQLQWTLPLGPFKSSYNVTSSPILFGDSVILCCDHGGDAFILAADSKTGKVRWRTPRHDGAHYSTPLLLRTKPAPQVVISAATVRSYDARDGRLLWSCRGLNRVVSPSPVWDGRLLYAASGRNGPALAIDPSGSGDVTETHVRTQLFTGGPYVVSPLALPQLLLPGDNGHLRLIDANGQVEAQLRLRDHFTASPVVANGTLYWPAEKGRTYVLRLTRDPGKPPAFKLLGVNDLGEKILASPAVADGRLYLRTAKALYSLAGAAKPTGPPPQAVTAAFLALKSEFEKHPAAQGDEVAVRLDIIERLAAEKSPEVAAFLSHVALKDPHWDVSEAAAKAIVEQNDPARTAAALKVLADRRPYLRVLAAQALARAGAADAIPDLAGAVRDQYPLVKVAALAAIGKIGQRDPAVASQVLPVLSGALLARDGSVRLTACRALGAFDTLAADPTLRRTLRFRLGMLQQDRNPLVAASALSAASRLGREEPAPAGSIQALSLYGAPRPKSVSQWLQAGPVRVKFADGELRYLHVGDREIIRRIYLGVRDKAYDTIMPQFAKIEVKQTAAGFQIEMEASCRGDTADYSWKGSIHGLAEGKIIFRVSGTPKTAFKSPRVGFCVLFGAEALAGQAFTALDAKGKTKDYAFPANVTGGALVKGKVAEFRYTFDDGLTVGCGVTGGGFGLEDQRNYGDSSYKAYHALGHSNWRAPLVPGETREDTLTVAVALKQPLAEAGQAPLLVRVGDKLLPGRVPEITAPVTRRPQSFGRVTGRRSKIDGAAAASWASSPAAHMPDEDTFMENLSAIIDQVRTVRARLAPKALIRIDPLDFDSPYPRPERDPRNLGLFGGAWLAGALGYLSLAGVDEVGLAVGPGPAASAVQDAFAELEGQQCLQVTVSGPRPTPVLAFAMRKDKGSVIWLINKTDQDQTLTLTGLTGRLPIPAWRLNAGTLAAPARRAAALQPDQDKLTLTLSPYEVVRLKGR